MWNSSRRGYASIPELNDDRNDVRPAVAHQNNWLPRRREGLRAWAVAVVGLMFCGLALFISEPVGPSGTTLRVGSSIASALETSTSTTSNSELQKQQLLQQHATTPSLLSIVHPATGKYLHALENPLYERLKQATFANSIGLLSSSRQSDKLQRHPRLFLDTTIIRPNSDDSLTLFWTMGTQELPSEADEAEDEDNTHVIALYCGNHILDIDVAMKPTFDPTNFLEAATIAQIRATNQQHIATAAVSTSAKGSLNPSNSWFIPYFPILRQESCRFFLLKDTTIETSGTTKVSTDDLAMPVNLQDHFTILAASDIIHIQKATLTPTGIHLSLGDVESSIMVHFTTGEPHEQHDEKNMQTNWIPVVQYGKRHENHNEPMSMIWAKGTTDTYSAEDLCQEPANITEAGKFYPPGLLHVVEMASLEPDMQYAYKVGIWRSPSKHVSKATMPHDHDDIVWSDLYTFTSPPKVGEPSDPFTFIVYGDQGCPSKGWGDGGVWTSALVDREMLSDRGNPPLRIVHHVGDLSYANGAAHVWDEWLRMILPFATQLPLMVAVGNHVRTPFLSNAKSRFWALMSLLGLDFFLLACLLSYIFLIMDTNVLFYYTFRNTIIPTVEKMGRIPVVLILQMASCHHGAILVSIRAENAGYPPANAFECRSRCRQPQARQKAMASFGTPMILPTSIRRSFQRNTIYRLGHRNVPG